MERPPTIAEPGRPIHAFRPPRWRGSCRRMGSRGGATALRDAPPPPGRVGAVVGGGGVGATEVVGVRKGGAPEPMRADDLVRLGSDTKAMTATMIGTLVDQGKLGWSSTIAEVFPG